MFTREGEILAKNFSADRDTEILLPVETHGQAGLWHKHSNLCFTDGAAELGRFRGYVQGARAQCTGSIPFPVLIHSNSCLFPELTTWQTLVLMVGGVKRNTFLTLLTVLVLLPILSSCKMLQKS